MKEIKRLAKILNIELLIIVVFVMLTGGGIFLVFRQHTLQSQMMMDRIKDEQTVIHLMDMDRFINIALGELFLFFLLLSAVFIIISRKFFASFIRSIVIDLTNKTKELEETKETLEEAKTVLEIKVGARTRELKELSESLEGQVKERTADLQKNIDELKRYNRLAVGRELKMIELKAEIKKLQQESENLKVENKRSKKLKL